MKKFMKKKMKISTLTENRPSVARERNGHARGRRSVVPGGMTAVLVGLGNIGSFAAVLLAQLYPLLTRLTLIDPDVFDEGNLGCHNIGPRACGRLKVSVLAEEIHRVAPELDVRAIPARVEAVPLGVLQADVIVSALDSRQARAVVQRAAWSVGACFIDSGVEPSELLSRIEVYIPGSHSPCYICQIDRDAAHALESRHPCSPARAPSHTAAPSRLGALTASLAVMEAEKFLRRDLQHLARSTQVIFDVRRHVVLRSALRRNRFCAFAHRQLRGVAPLDWRQGRLKLGDLFEAGRGLVGGGARALKVPVIEELRMEVLGQAFTTALRCTCGAQRNLLRLTERIAARDNRCPSCGAAMAATGFDLMEELRVGDLPGSWRRQAVRSLGLQRGDFIRFSSKHRVSVVELVDDGMGGRHA